MKLDQLKYFLEVARHEHLGKAAKILAISPSAISHSVAALEEELGRELFEKKGKRIYLTGHGKLLVERARVLLEDVDRIREEIISDQADLQGHLRLSATHMLAEDVVSTAWMKVQLQHSSLSAEIYTLRSAEVVARVASSEFDFGLCFSPQSHPGLESREIHRGNLLLAVRRDHPLTKLKPTEAMRKVNDYPAVLPKAFQGIESCETHPVFREYSVVPRVKVMFDSFPVARSLIISSDCWCLLPDWVVQKDSEMLAVIAIPGWKAPYTISAIWARNRQLPRALKLLLEELKNQIGPTRSK